MDEPEATRSQVAKNWIVMRCGGLNIPVVWGIGCAVTILVVMGDERCQSKESWRRVGIKRRLMALPDGQRGDRWRISLEGIGRAGQRWQHHAMSGQWCIED